MKTSKNRGTYYSPFTEIQENIPKQANEAKGDTGEYPQAS